MPPYTVLYIEKVVRVTIPSLPVAVREVITRAIDERLTADPTGLGKPMQYKFKGYRRLRVGGWRVIYRVEGQIVTVTAIVNRRDAYKER